MLCGLSGALSGPAFRMTFRVRVRFVLNMAYNYTVHKADNAPDPSGFPSLYRIVPLRDRFASFTNVH